MSKKPLKSQASSARAVSGALGGSLDGLAFNGGFGSSTFGSAASSPLSYVYEPADLSGISEPNIVVAFKNLQKKDATTKTKALEDLQAYVLSTEADKGSLEETILEAWIKVYPRTSIDIARRVRQLAHTLQGRIAISCGKRLAKHMPAIVASWLAGQYDNDTSVNRAANESFNCVFGSEEKRKNVWKVYQSSIFQYATGVLVKETIYTLSDERTISPDDASAKYSRVVGAALLLVKNLLDNSSKEDLEKNRNLIDIFLAEEKIWKFASHDDPFVRRALYRLLVVVLAKEKNALNPSTVSANMLTLGLHANQFSSAFDFAKAIAILTIELPDVWTVHYSGSGRRSAQNRLCHFLKRGSQGGPAKFWEHVSTLLSNLPPKILTQTAEEASKTDDGHWRPYSPILSALHEGLNSKDGARANQGTAWNTYLHAVELVQSSLPGVTDRHQLYLSSVLPILTQYIRPSPEQSLWAVADPQQRSVCMRACELVSIGDLRVFAEEWRALSVSVIEDLNISLPEQSKEFEKSQDAVLAETNRWYDLQASLLRGSQALSMRPIFGQSISSEVFSITSTLTAKNGEPYGAASALVALVQAMPELVLSDNAITETLIGFVNNTLPGILLSPSAHYLIRLLNLLEDKISVRPAYEKCMQILVDAPESSAKAVALQSFVSSPRLADTNLLSGVVKNSMSQAMKGDRGASWDIVMTAINNPVAPKQMTDDILANITEGLSISAETLTALDGLEKSVKHNEGLVKQFAISYNGSSLRSKLLILTDSPNDSISLRARNLNSILERMLSVNGDSSQAVSAMIKIVNEGLDRAGIESLSVDALVSQAQKLLEQASPTDSSTMAGELLPSTAQWNDALMPFLLRPANASLANTNSFGCAVYLATDPSSTSIQSPIPRDAEGYTTAMRIAQYTVKLLKNTSVFDSAAKEQKVAACKSIAVFLQLAGDNLSVPGAVPLWNVADADLESEVVDFIAEAQAFLASWLTSDFIIEVQNRLLVETSGISVASYYNARAYSVLTTEIAELQGIHIFQSAEIDRFKQLRNSVDFFMSVALLTTASDSKELLKLCNGLLADLTGQSLGDKVDEVKTLKDFVLLNCILYRPEGYVDEIPQQRLVFFVKHVLEQAQDGFLLAPGIGGEIMKAFSAVLPAIKGIYGSFWADILDGIPRVWVQGRSDEHLYGIHCSLRLLSLLKKSDMQQSNDDLLDAWMENKDPIARGLVELIVRLRDVPDESHQPRRIVNELLSRLLTGISQDVNIEVAALYPVLASESAALQQAAYELLHKHIPNAQEQISLDKALIKDFVAQIPQELLSLILAPPSINTMVDHNFERTMPPSLRSYLLSWKLTFDHWQNASYKVQADYVAALKEGTYTQDFLAFALNILISARYQPVDASKFDIETYIPEIEESPEKETYHLLIHLYYLSLRYLPFLSKEWWRDTASRQLNIAAEFWTQKYISPLIIASELSTISAWAPTQATDDQPMTVRVSPSAREITASIPIDEQTMTISVHLPPSYPLARAEVKSIQRVGVAEKIWSFWLINAQGVMNLSSASAGVGSALVDGLVAWRKNVRATMKGQTECAICYSVVGGDRQLPSKKCSTCMKCFHSGCLFKWFRSSNSSSCPLCRNSFNYS